MQEALYEKNIPYIRATAAAPAILRHLLTVNEINIKYCILYYIVPEFYHYDKASGTAETTLKYIFMFFIHFDSEYRHNKFVPGVLYLILFDIGKRCYSSERKVTS